MTILLSGGGTGGHITPLLAVAHELKRLRPEVNIVYVGERRGKFANLAANNSDIDEIHSIFAGKLRRYHGESWLTRLFDFKTNLLNIRDACFAIIGFFQSYFLLGKIRPKAILLKGGFVGAPVGLAAAIRRIPFITHDSDAIPGLANRLVSRWAKLHATGQPTELYNYPKDSTVYVGVLVSSLYRPVNRELQKHYRELIGIFKQLFDLIF